jgi:hypothetical protein
LPTELPQIALGIAEFSRFRERHEACDYLGSADVRPESRAFTQPRMMNLQYTSPRPAAACAVRTNGERAAIDTSRAAHLGCFPSAQKGSLGCVCPSRPLAPSKESL